MIALPVNATDEELAGHVLDNITPTNDLDAMVREVMRAAFQAGLAAQQAHAEEQGR